MSAPTAMSVLRMFNPMRGWSGMRGALALGPLAFTLVGMLGPALELFMSMDKNYDRIMMRTEDTRDLFDFIIGKLRRIKVNATSF